jgi:hypothetical protein
MLCCGIVTRGVKCADRKSNPLNTAYIIALLCSKMASSAGSELSRRQTCGRLPSQSGCGSCEPLALPARIKSIANAWKAQSAAVGAHETKELFEATLSNLDLRTFKNSAVGQTSFQLAVGDGVCVFDRRCSANVADLCRSIEPLLQTTARDPSLELRGQPYECHNRSRNLGFTQCRNFGRYDNGPAARMA